MIPSLLIAWITGLACAGTPQVPTSPTPSPNDTVQNNSPQPDAEAQEVYEALSVREPAPRCDSVKALTQTPVATLLFVVEHAKMPPWAGIRAAQCLVWYHAEEIETEMIHWVNTEDTRGFAMVVIDALDRMPIATAMVVAPHALSSPLADETRVRIEESSSAQLRTLLQ